MAYWVSGLQILCGFHETGTLGWPEKLREPRPKCLIFRSEEGKECMEQAAPESPPRENPDSDDDLPLRKAEP